MSAETTGQFRRRYRAKEIGPRYSGLAHLAFTTLACLGAIALCLSRLEAVQAWEWLSVPFSFLLANFVEYAGHRGPMHHRWRGLGLIHKRHAGFHHSFFTREHMALEGRRDFKVVLFPPLLLLFFFGGFALPIGLLLALATTANVAWLFAATSIAYFLNYELLHLAYHSPENSWLDRLPGIASLRRHHAHHHDPAFKSAYNFNITYPIADRLMGTYRDHTRGETNS